MQDPRTAALPGLSPRIREEGDRLVGKTSFGAQALMLFFGARTVIVDRASRWVFVRTRYFWILRRGRAIPFRRVRHIEYRYGGAMTPWEMFVVQLALRDPDERIDLLTFAGDDPHTVGLTELMVGSLGGAQEQASRGYVELLSRYLDVPLGPSLGS